MSARNYLSTSDKNYGKLYDCLPNINQQKFGYRSTQELPPLSANTSSFLNRNLNYSYDLSPYLVNSVYSVNRSGTPLSDFFSDSEGGNTDSHSEESDSSSGSILRRSTAEATKTLSEEWDRIERTLYNENGEKSNRLQIIEECNQWRQLHPQLRVVGKAIQLPERRSSYRQVEQDEMIASHHDDRDLSSGSEERLSQSSTDVTPQNSPRPSVASIPDPHTTEEHRISRDRVSFYPAFHDEDLPESFCSLLQITPIQIRSPSQRRKQNSSILRSELASSRWMRNSRPDSSFTCDRNSAKSFVSLDRNYMALSAPEPNKILNGRVGTARHKDLARLAPLSSPEPHESPKTVIGSQQYQLRKVSLPPLLLDEEKRKVASAKKTYVKAKKRSQPFYQLDRVRY